MATRSIDSEGPSWLVTTQKAKLRHSFRGCLKNTAFAGSISERTMVRTLTDEFPKQDDCGMNYDSEMPLDDVVADIVRIHEGIESTWKNSWGWAPDTAARLLEESRLDWLVSL